MWRTVAAGLLATVATAAWAAAEIDVVRVDTDVLTVRSTAGTVDVRTTATPSPLTRSRVATVLPTHVEVAETIVNPTAAVAGVRLRHGIATTGAGWIGGRDDPGVARLYDPWNPTAFAATTGGGVGLIAEDDVLRNQLVVTRDGASVGLGTDMFCLAPGASYTTTWSVYPTSTGDYFDFVDRIRRDWHANDVTVPGALIWFRPDDVLARPLPALRDALAAQNVAIASLSGGWVDPLRADTPPRIGFGTDVLGDAFAAYRRRIRAAVARLHEARPGMRVLLYFDAQRDGNPDAARRFDGELLRDADGRVERSDFGGRFTPSVGLVPVLGGAFGDALPAVAAAMRDDLGADGLYWDEMDAVDYAGPRLTTATWDGHSCRLAADGRVIGTVGLANLLSDAVKARIAGDAMVLGNSPPTTRRFRDRHDLRMVEAQHNDDWGTFVHLTTPLGYVGSWLDWPRLRAKVDEGVLVAGGSLDRPSAFVARMFPFTPEEIRPGVLRGRERIVATRGGDYGWRDATGTVRCFRYDATGAEHIADWAIERRGDGAVVHVTLAQGEAAIIERDR